MHINVNFVKLSQQFRHFIMVYPAVNFSVSVECKGHVVYPCVGLLLHVCIHILL